LRTVHPQSEYFFDYLFTGYLFTKVFLIRVFRFDSRNKRRGPNRPSRKQQEQ
jgi:hypothetical protein